MRIRSVGIEGAGQLAEMDKHCFSDSWKEKDWQQFLSLPQYRCYIVTAEELPKGFLLISTAADEGEIIKIGVLPECRRQNFGTSILREAFEKWQDEGIRHLFLEVRESNRPARALYQKLGFEEVGIRKNYYRNPQEHAVVYARHFA